MKTHFWGRLLLVIVLVGCLSGCGKKEEAILSMGTEYQYQNTTITLEFVSLSNYVTAPMASGGAGTWNTYRAPDENGDARRASYLDCVATVTNNGEKKLDLSDAMFLYAMNGDTTNTDCLLFTESEDGSELIDADFLAAGKSTRLHYVLVLPKDAKLSDYTLYLNTTAEDKTVVYAKEANQLLPAGDMVKKGTELTGASGTVLTMQSAKTTDTVIPAGAEDSKSAVTVSQDGNVLLDIQLTAKVKEDTAVGALCGGYMLSDTAIVRAVPVLEQQDGLTLSGTISAKDPAQVHLIFELEKKPSRNEKCCLYLDGKWYPIDI